jgi:lipopolysaccharide transport system ATP-binding protein
MRRADILRRFDEIVAFAEIGEFLDTPVKHYSSGMYMRLAFAVAAHLEPETLVIDEVLAVGDAAFQKKCLGKMGDVARHGRTVLFVSHNMGAVRALCTRCLVLHGGTLRFDGSPNEAVAYYMANIAGAVDENDGSVSWPTDPPEVNELRLRAVRLVDATGRPQSTHESGDPVRVEVDYEVKLPLRGSRMSVFVSTQEGEVAFVSTDHLATMDEQAPGLYRSTCTIPGKLLNRRAYVVGVSWDIPSQRIVFDRRDFLSFVVTGSGNQGSNFPEAWPGVVCPRLDWTVERL